MLRAVNGVPPRSEAEANFPTGKVAAESVLHEFLLTLRDELYIEVASILSPHRSSEVRPGCDGQTAAVRIAAGPIGR